MLTLQRHDQQRQIQDEIPSPTCHRGTADADLQLQRERSLTIDSASNSRFDITGGVVLEPHTVGG